MNVKEYEIKAESIKELNVDLMFRIQDGGKTIYKVEFDDFGIFDLIGVVCKLVKKIISSRKKNK